MIEWTQYAQGTAHITVTGRLDAHEAPRLRECFEETREAGLARCLVTMQGVDFMDSAGLASVVSGLKSARQHGGDLVIVSPSPMVQKVLELTLLNQVIPIQDTLESSPAGPH
ncbi:anti-sigma-B factor antagonist [Deinococcus malanensis]|uniref:Anti-sigma factor antagonist n=1 Tax=Deinococcus malanensis TaxID=1706855 RepID=A0ABQ2F0X0_9DEIO|nr:STAS domain-containing protein [Deinococcus malanensis]GGK39805.1 anti-sigma-B factor antagonist [Deinococcus malanensis]